MAVTGGDEPLGRALLEAFLGRGGEVRATVATRAAQRDLVPLGVRTARVAVDDLDALAAVLRGVHTLVHAAGTEPGQTLAPVREAAALAGVRRVVVVSAAGDEQPGLVVVRPGPDAVEQVLRADDR